jgi:5,10-methylenetetrahydromethanopterin reductase
VLSDRRIGLCFLSVLPIKEVVRIAQIADEAGIDSVWIGEGYHFFRHLHGEARSATTTAAALAVSTRRIKIGLGIIPPYTRHPALIAMEATALQELSDGRFILGLGVAKAAVVHLGIDHQDLRALGTHREAIQVIRALLAGQPVQFAGKIYKVDAPALPAGDQPVPRVPIIIGATGPKLLALGGEMADAVLLPTFTTPAFVRYAATEIQKGADKAGRRLADVPIGATLPFSVDDDGAAARNAIRELTAVYIANKIQNIKNDVILQCAGLTEAEASPISEAITRRGAKAAARLVTDEIMDKVVVAGTPREVNQKLQALAMAGLRLPLFYQILGPDRERAIGLIAEKVKPVFEGTTPAQ